MEGAARGATGASAHRRIVLAVDASSIDEAKPLVEKLAPHVGVLKIGLELFTREGPRAVAWARSLGVDVFLDLKLHDIPETVERAVASAGAMGARYLTVHASGGRAMLERAASRAAREGGPTILAVTVLTSLDEGDLHAGGIAGSVAEHVLRLSSIAWGAGVRGFVSSASEARLLRSSHGPDATLVTPGIRLPNAQRDDQKRVTTPADAVRAGANLLVVGRPIRDADDPVAAARTIAADVVRALA